MNNYKVSIIMPCYNISLVQSNESNTFQKAINSVMNQTVGFENIELILVNDNSSDNTLEILTNLSEQYSNIKIITLDENSGGPSIPRNIGIQNASADYVMFLDQDDSYSENAVEVLYNEIINSDADFLNSNYNSFDGVNYFRHKSKNGGGGKTGL